LLNHALDIQADQLGISDLSSIYRGSIIPHMITQEILSLESHQLAKPKFCVRDNNHSSAEVDLVLRYQDTLIPIEIKSGTVETLRSLHQFVDRAPHPYAARMYAGPFKVERYVSLGKTRIC